MAFGARHLPDDFQTSAPRQQLLHKLSALLLSLGPEVSFEIRRLPEVVGLIWGFSLSCNVQFGYSSTVTVMHPSNKLLKLKPHVG